MGEPSRADPSSPAHNMLAHAVSIVDGMSLEHGKSLHSMVCFLERSFFVPGAPPFAPAPPPQRWIANNEPSQHSYRGIEKSWLWL